MVGWHHQLTGHVFEQAPGDGEGQGGLVRYSPWSHKELDMTEQLNKNKYLKFIGCFTELYVLLRTHFLF